MNNQLDLFGFEPPPKKAPEKPIIKRESIFSPDLEEVKRNALERLRSLDSGLKPTDEKIIREWVALDYHHSLNPDYHVAAYTIGLLKVCGVNNETIIQALL